MVLRCVSVPGFYRATVDAATGLKCLLFVPAVVLKAAPTLPRSVWLCLATLPYRKLEWF